MAKKARRKKSSETANGGIAHTIKSAAMDVVDEVEKAGGVVLGEIRNSFQFISTKVTDTAKSAADTTIAVKDKVTSKDVTDQLYGLLQDVEEVGESLVKVIGQHFQSLRRTLASSPQEVSAEAAAKRKPVAKKKAVARKKLGTKKKAVVTKKATAKKATATKTTETRSKAAVGRKSAARKTGVRKKTVAKKSAAKKAATRKKIATRKKAAARTRA
jgi:hypothetical protein